MALVPILARGPLMIGIIYGPPAAKRKYRMQFRFPPHGGSTISVLAASHTRDPHNPSQTPPCHRLISVSIDIFLPHGCSIAKKRKVDNEKGHFQEWWKLQYFFAESRHNCVSLILKQSVVVVKELNVKRPYQTTNDDAYDKFTGRPQGIVQYSRVQYRCERNTELLCRDLFSPCGLDTLPFEQNNILLFYFTNAVHVTLVRPKSSRWKLIYVFSN